MKNFYPIKHRFLQAVIITVLILTAFNTQNTSASSQKPDLIVTEINTPPATEGNTITVEVTIKNIGLKDITGEIKTAIYVDGNTNPTSTSTTTGLHGGGEKTIQLPWTAEAGEHILRATADYQNNIIEENESNNELSKLITVSPAPYDLTIENIELNNNMLKVNDKALINVTIKNNGHTVSQKIDVKVTVNGYSNTSYINDNLPSNAEKNLLFTWTPQKPGLYHLKASVDSSNKINESNEKNNFLEKTVLVIDDFPWWNNSWHYRLLVATQNNGIISHSFNFTQLLHNLSLFNAEFDNNSIRVISYSETGEIIGVTNYMFNENKEYNSKNKSTGMLTWLANSVFSMIYFDVKENGEKNNTEKHVEETNTTQLLYIGEPEGWNTLIIKPKNNTLILPNTTTMFQVESNAKLNEVKGVTSTGNTTLLFNLKSKDNTTWYSNQSFTKEGKYTLIITASDKAGYTQKKSCVFTVGKADLTAKDLTFSTTKIFKNTPVNIECTVATNTFIDNITVNVYINNSLLANKTISFENTLEKTVTFQWTPTYVGIVNVLMRVDPFKKTLESNENNNIINRIVTIYNPPDIMIKKMSVTSPVKEGTTAYVHVEIETTGLSASTNCKVHLYASQTIMRWQSSERVYTENITLPPNKPFNVTLPWNPVTYGASEEKGRWIIGVEVTPVSPQQDLNLSNNRKNMLLTVNPEERNPPTISKIWCEPSTLEVGGDITVYAEIADDTGIHNVTLTIKKPDNKTKKYLMKYDKTTGRWYLTITSLKTPGLYTYHVTATDESYLRNKGVSHNATFIVTKDHTPPEIIDIWLTPGKTQLKNHEIQIFTIVHDNVEVNSVNVTIIDPNGEKTEKNMQKIEKDTYRFSKTFNTTGRYTFFVSAADQNNNKMYSELQDFWVTEDLNDTDNDHIPDWWEKRYGFDPYNPMDAQSDQDGDGYNELMEYNEGLNPLQPNTVFGLSQNELTVAVTVILLFTIIIVLSLAAMRKK